MLGTLTVVERLDHLSLRRARFARRWVHTSAGRVHAYEHQGPADLPTVVVVHGINTRGSTLRPTLEPLRHRLGRLVVPELPGHGFSDTPAAGLNPETLRAGLTEALDALIDEPVILFGNSLGGLAAIRYAIDRPEKVRALLLNSPAGAPMSRSDLVEFLSTFDVPRRRDAKRFVEQLHVHPPWYAPLIAGGVRRRFRRPAMRSLVRGITTEVLLDPSDLADLSLPIRLVWGQQDHLMPPGNLAFYREHLPEHAVVEEPSGVGHCPYLDRPEVLVEAIANFAEAQS